MNDITPLIDWIKANVPGLLHNDKTWQISLHGGRDGNIVVEVKTSCQLVASRKQRLDERSNGNVRPVRTPV